MEQLDIPKPLAFLRQFEQSPETVLKDAEKGELGVKLLPEDFNEARGVVKKIIELIEEFERKARVPHKEIPNDIDIVWVISAPGIYSEDFPIPPAKIGRWGSSWTKEMYRHRLRSGIALINQITAQRVGKRSDEVTTEDIRNSGPTLLYNPAPEDKEHIEAILSQPSVRIPKEKTFIFYDVDDESGKPGPIKNAFDQVKSFHLPEGLNPRTIAVVSHSLDLVRLLFIWENHKGNLPKDTKVYPFPIRIPAGSEEEYFLKTVRGILENIYILKRSANRPIEYLS